MQTLLRMKVSRRWTALSLAALLGVATMSSAHAATPAKASPLFTPEQLKVEALVAQLVATPEMKLQKAELLKRYQADPAAATPSGQQTMRGAVDELAAAAALGAANGDPSNPKLIWSLTPQVDWNQHRKWAGRWAVDNPDNIYRFFPVSGKYRYEMKIKPRSAVAPAQYSFLIWDTYIGEDTKQNHYLDSPIAGLLDRDVKTPADGSFTVTIDSDPANGRANHIQSNADARILFIRETHDQWGKQLPFDIQVKRVDKVPAAPASSFRQLAERSAYLMKHGADTVFWFKNTGLVNPQPNQLSKPWLRGGGWGFNVNGQFKLAADEALLISVDRKGAKYMSLVVTDPWLRTREHIRGNGTLNNTQAEANADGSYTFVVSATDPGIRNWADTEGLLEGLILFRWQALPADLKVVDDAVRSIKVVKLADLPNLLPAEATRVTPVQRVEQYAARAATYAPRYLP